MGLEAAGIVRLIDWHASAYRYDFHSRLLELSEKEMFTIDAPRQFMNSHDFYKFRDRLTLVDSDLSGMLSRWNSYILENPKVICDALFKDVELAAAVMARLPQGGRLMLDINLMDSEGLTIGDMSHRVEFTTHEAELCSASVKDSHSRSGVGACLIRNIFALYERWEIRKVDIVAARTVGGYAWARLGWLPIKECWQALRHVLSDRYATHVLLFNDLEHRVISGALKSNDPRAIWRLTDLDREIPRNGIRGAEMAIGKIMLLDTAWIGYFDCTDDRARKRLRSYLESKGLL